MIINMRSFKASVLVLCGILHWAAAEQPELISASPPEYSDKGYFPPPPSYSDLTEVGSLCKNTTSLSVPADGKAKIITGTHSKLYSFMDCSYYYQGPLPATVYQIEGTGTMLEASLFSGPFGSSNEVAVFEGCPSQPDTTGGTDSSGNMDNNMNNNMLSNCVAGQSYQSARWQAKAGQLYTIVVYSYSGQLDFILRLATFEASPLCAAEGESAISPINLGTVNTTAGSLKRLGGPEDSVLVTDLPQCDYQTQSSSVLYKITVSQPNVSVSVYVEGGDSYVTVYKGNCTSGYSCLPVMNVGYGPIYDKGVTNATDIGEEVIVDEEEVEVDQPETRQGDISMPRYNFNMHSFHNEKAGSTYLVSISSCCGADVSDFRLTVNTSTYGDVCEDSVAADLSSGNFSATVESSKGKVYRDLTTCSNQGYYEGPIVVSPDGTQASSSSSTYIEMGGPLPGPATFYKITGDGKSYVAYTAPLDPNMYYGQVRMALFTSSSCDEKPQCVQGDNYSNFISIKTTVGETYYLALYNEYAENLGSFDLKISAVSNKTPCEDAVDLGTVGSAGRKINGTMAGAGFYKDLNLCNLYAEVGRPRVFSFVAEEDGPIMASLKVPSMLNFYPQVTVLTSCGDAECIPGLTSFEAEPMSPAAVWNAESGVTYYVIVVTYEMFNTGKFQLSLEPLVTTQVCESENVVDLGTVPDEGAMFEGSTVGVPLFSVPTSCQPEGGYFSALTRAATFSLTGDGSAYMLSVSDTYSFTPQIAVFKGSCDNLECIPMSPSSSNVLVDTKQNETYTILIGDCCSAGGMGGTFKLHVKKVAAGNVTADVTETIVGNETKALMGSTLNGLFYPGLPVCVNPINSPAAVYKVDAGAGHFSLRASGFGFDVLLSLLKADGSGGFECHGRNENRQISWEGKQGDSLYLVVHGCCDENAVGDFSLRFNKSSASGDPCDDVTDLGDATEDGLMHIGSLAGWSYATAANETVCEYKDHYAASGGRSKIFTVVGNGKTLVAAAFTSQSMLNQGNQVSVTVVKGVCGEVECIEDAYSESYTGSSLTWPSTAGETYDVVVSYCCSDSDDDFVLMVYEEGTKSYGNAYPIMPLEGDQSVANVDGETVIGSDEAVSDGSETVNSVASNSTKEENSALEANSASTAIGRMPFFVAMAMLATVWL